MKRLPSYIVGWFLGITTISVFHPVSLALAAKALGVVLILFFLLNFKHIAER